MRNIHRRIRFCDGIIGSIVERIKQKVQTFGRQIKELPRGKRILLIISKLIKLLRLSLTAYQIFGAKRISRLLQANIEKLAQEKNYSQQKSQKLLRGSIIAYGIIQSIIQLAAKGLESLTERIALKNTEFEV